MFNKNGSLENRKLMIILYLKRSTAFGMIIQLTKVNRQNEETNYVNNHP